jgi:hypothetical protein
LEIEGMKRAATLLLAVLPVFPQVTATVKPVSISGAQGAIGGKRVGLWTVSLSSRYASPVDLPHERITESFPLLRDIPNRLAEDLLTRQSSNSFWSILARWGPPVLTAGVTAYGPENRIGQGIVLATLLFGRAGQRAPAPSVYFSDFCPEHIGLAAYGAMTCYIASGIVKGAVPMTAVIDIPSVQSGIR